MNEMANPAHKHRYHNRPQEAIHYHKKWEECGRKPGSKSSRMDDCE